MTKSKSTEGHTRPSTGHGYQPLVWRDKLLSMRFAKSRSHTDLLEYGTSMSLWMVAKDFINEITASGGSLLLVGTSNPFRDVIQDEGERCGMPYVSNQWSKGLLTNFASTLRSIERLNELYATIEEGTLSDESEHDVARLVLELNQIGKVFRGLRKMSRLPDAMLVWNAKQEIIAAQEARELGIPVIGFLLDESMGESVDLPLPIRTNEKPISETVRFVSDTIVQCNALRPKSANHLFPTDQFERMFRDDPSRTEEVVREVVRLRYKDEAQDLVVALSNNALAGESAYVEQARLKAEARKSIAEEFGLLSSEDVKRLFGIEKYQLSRLVKAKKLLRVEFRGAFRYPGFQFDADKGSVRIEMKAILDAFGDEDGWAILHWLTSPSDYLADDDNETQLRPIDVLDLPEELDRVLAAETGQLVF